MTPATLAIKNIGRHRSRTLLTAIGIALAIVLFVLMRTFVSSWEGAIDHAAKDRIATRHKITFVMSLPKRYADDIKALPEVADVTWMNWFGGKDENRPTEFFGTIAVDADSFLRVYDEILVEETRVEAWKSNRRGALVGDKLAAKFGWSVGDRVVLTGTIYPGQWEFVVEGIYTAERKSVDRSTFWFHWDYLNESLPEGRQDQIGWITSRVRNAGASAQTSKAIDALFDDRDIQTLTMSEKAMQQSFLGMVSAVLTAVDIVSIAILVIIVLILGNTIGMAVRERTREYGCLRAIGFSARQVVGFVVGEAVTIGVLGGLLGLVLAYVLVAGALGPFLEEEMGAMFPYFRVSPSLAVLAVALAGLLGVFAAMIPAYRAARLNVVDALRSLD